MVSHKHKFIFVHVPKTAGNSIQNHLIEYSEDNIKVSEAQAQYNIDSKSYLDRFEIRSSDEKFKIHKHTTLNQYYVKWREEYEDIEGYFKFGVIRNPWDRAISYYFWKGHKSFNKRKFMNDLFQRSCADYFYVEKYKDHKLDYVIRFENLQEGFNTVCDRIGIPQQQLPFANKSKHKHYTEYYDEETKQIVAKKYARDIDYFEYKFGD